MEMLYALAQENITINKSPTLPPIPTPTPIPTPISTTLDADIRELKRDMLALKNDHARIENDLEWRSEVRSRGL
ncbi:hypothetical protein Glove_426g35 [Diversispora epigaea]|uniref:Uncharacterized protein n=1 Tax=Diversispora epigaea TaxID=1348612 RepID=A0A397H2E3_9GLOM|nr:hypothetical protein Glove_426g35 [Diversispora epigaea]